MDLNPRGMPSRLAIRWSKTFAAWTLVLLVDPSAFEGAALRAVTLQDVGGEGPGRLRYLGEG